jgi:2-polyprenyl-6-methoxyphenol hydroxylase-like FAD-dependent oxidoreductase
MDSTGEVSDAVSESTSPVGVVVLGDASVSAHYRLGVGFNHALRTVLDMRTVFEAYVSEWSNSSRASIRVQQTLESFGRASERRIHALVQFQMFAMFFEAYCSAVAYRFNLFEHTQSTFDMDEAYDVHSLAARCITEHDVPAVLA